MFKDKAHNLWVLYADASGFFAVDPGDSVPLLRIHSDNKTLDRGLPRFYDCIDNAIDHSVKKQKDPYFKAEPTLNEVLGCYYKNFVDGTVDKHKDK